MAYLIGAQAKSLRHLLGVDFSYFSQSDFIDFGGTPSWIGPAIGQSHLELEIDY